MFFFSLLLMLIISLNFFLKIIRNGFEKHFQNVCQFVNQNNVFKSWKNGFFRDSKQNVCMSILIPFGLKNILDDPNEDPLFQFLLLFNQTWTMENSPEFTDDTLETFSGIQKRYIKLF